MSAGFWAAIGLALLKLWGLISGGKGYRAKVEVRSESAIADERKHLEELSSKVRQLQGELDAITQKALAEMRLINQHRGSLDKWHDLDCRRRLHARALNDATAEYDDAQRSAAQSG